MARRFPVLLLFFFLFLGLPFSASVDAGKKIPPAKPVNLNTANSEELQRVPGIGPVTADKIRKMRKYNGPFHSVDDLRAIRGIGPKRLEKMRKYLTVGKSAAAKSVPSAQPAPPEKKTPDKP